MQWWDSFWFYFCYREVDVNFLGTTAPLNHQGKDGVLCTQEDLLIYMKDFLSWMAQDTLQYHLLTLNFIVLPSSTSVFGSLHKHLFIVFFWKMMIHRVTVPRQQGYFGLKEWKSKPFKIVEDFSICALSLELQSKRVLLIFPFCCLEE